MRPYCTIFGNWITKNLDSLDVMDRPYLWGKITDSKYNNIWKLDNKKSRLTWHHVLDQFMRKNYRFTIFMISICKLDGLDGWKITDSWNCRENDASAQFIKFSNNDVSSCGFKTLFEINRFVQSWWQFVNIRVSTMKN